MTGIGLVGLGAISAVHARAIADAGGAVLVGAFSMDIKQMEAFARVWSCSAYPSLDRMLADPRIDALAICTPSGAHLDVALAAIAAGKHLLIEKPLEVTTERGERIVHAAAERGVLVSGVFQSRFYRAATLVKDAVRSGRFGRISLADAYVKWYRTQEYYSGSGWRGTWHMDGGGALMNQSIHMMDILAWLMGDPERVFCAMGTPGHDGIEVEDTAVVTLSFPGGALGVLEGTTAAYPGFFKRFEISGTEGTAIVEEDRIVHWEFAKEDTLDTEIREEYEVGRRSPNVVPRFEPEHAAHARQYRDFISAVDTGRPLAIDGWEALRAVRLVEAAYSSSRSGSSVAKKSDEKGFARWE
jgi:predicted dehydrogenase